MSDAASGRGKYCSACERDVHFAADLTRAEIGALLESRRAGERLCFALLVRKSDGAVRVADGHVHPARTGSPRRLPLLAVAASMTMAACAPPVAPAPRLEPAAAAKPAEAKSAVNTPEAPPPVADNSAPVGAGPTRLPDPKPPAATAPSAPAKAPPPHATPGKHGKPAHAAVAHEPKAPARKPLTKEEREAYEDLAGALTGTNSL